MRRRPAVLFAALLAPAIFAVGLLAGDAGRSGPKGGRPVVTAGEGPVGFGPVAVPGPVRAFAAAVPARVPSPERVVPSAEEVPVVKAVVAPRGKSRKPRVKDRGREVAPEVEGCAGEWEDTWLWEMCREREWRVAAGMRGRG